MKPQDLTSFHDIHSSPPSPRVYYTAPAASPHDLSICGPLYAAAASTFQNCGLSDDYAATDIFGKASPAILHGR
ncbi:Zinc finger CCCH domain-containing protein 25 [Fusarium oxysporum f. sp. albedinis]|nr:Zinc finger CCCH domain-containing protein 25 [Fusarium oxysporum f. sp. albedinis]